VVAMPEKLVIIPTYNEKENIEKITRVIFALPGGFHILAVDDNSPDGTANIIKKLQQEFPDRLFLIERKGKLGLGTAYITAFKWGIEHDYQYMIEMDADFSHNPDDLPKLYNACRNGADMSIGSRYCNGVSVINWPIGRVVMSYFASTYVRRMLHIHVFDCTAGFVCYSKKVLETIDFDRVKMHGYGFQIEMKYTASKLGFKIGEVPIIFVDRKEGTSKMSSGIFGEAFWGVIKLKFRKVRAKTRAKTNANANAN
jgi:dolichol-phosphate mannosyltransferase